MDLLQIFILALVQGLTEFLPVSSSAHLILVPKLLGWADQGLIFDVAVHFGTLLAVLIYFRQELIRMSQDWIKQIFGQGATLYSNLAWQLIIATIPVCILGYVLHDFIASALRSPLVIAGSTIIFAGLLWFSDKSSKAQKPLTDMTWKSALKIGGYQALALIPGVSRAGITITAGLGLGFSRENACRFSFLLSIPVILSAVALEGIKLFQSDPLIAAPSLLIAIGISAISAYACIHILLKLVNKLGMLPFVIYRIILGCALFIYFA